MRPPILWIKHKTTKTQAVLINVSVYLELNTNACKGTNKIVVVKGFLKE